MSNFQYRFLTSLFFAPLVLLAIYLGDIYFNLLLIITLALGIYELLLLNNKIIFALIIFLFLIFLYAFYQIRFSYKGKEYIIFCLLLTWCSDIGGYVFGKIIGGKKINIVSPNKTYSGFVGALLFPQIMLFYLMNKNFFLNMDLSDNIFLILILTIVSILGDLFFSYIKRLIKIKDFSNLLPGHGGLFDRIDSLIFVIITFFFIIYKL